MQITMTKSQALAIQRDQIEHYRPLFVDVEERVSEITTAEQIEDGVEYPMEIIDRHIPRGSAIESLLGLNSRTEFAVRSMVGDGDSTNGCTDPSKFVPYSDLTDVEKSAFDSRQGISPADREIVAQRFTRQRGG